MKKFFVVLTAFAFVMAMSLPAMADVSVLGTIGKTKTKTVTETVNIDKAHYVGVKQIVKPSSSAEAQALKNDVNKGNMITETEIPAVPEGAPQYSYNPITKEYIVIPGTSSAAVPAVPLTKTAAIDGGVLEGASGIVNVNQSPGSINNQGNTAAISYSATAAPIVEITDGSEGETRFVGGAFLHAESSSELINGDSPIDSVDGQASNVVNATGSTRTNTIDGALGNVTGIVGVNQSAGNINNQNNAASISVGNGIAALSEADLGMCNSGNLSIETGTTTTDTLTGAALASASGVIGINQSSGCMNNQANVVAACVLVHP